MSAETAAIVTGTMQLLTHSRMQCAKSCLRKHYFRYELGLRPDRDSTALRVGSAYHLALEAYDTNPNIDYVEGCVRTTYSILPSWCQSDDDLTAWRVECETVIELFKGHAWYWQNDELKVVWSEQSFELPIRNPATGERSRIWNMAGKIDRIIQMPDGRIAIQEYKTTGEDLSPDSDYWKRLRIDSQISLYLLAARELGHDAKTSLYYVTRKPSIRPKQVGKDKHVETPEEFGTRLSEDIRSRPEFYYARKEIPRVEADLEEFQAELWQQQQLLRDCQRLGRWYRNTGSCLGFGRCEFLDICSEHRNVETETPQGFIRVSDIHPELNLISTKG